MDQMHSWTSAVSCTTRGGVDYDDLASQKVEPYYTFRLMQTTKAGTDPNLESAKTTLIKWVDDTIKDIQIQSDRNIVKFYIGKTYVRKVKNRKFDAMKPLTWKKGGISSRWHCHKKESYGKNGMVVLTVVTKGDVPQKTITAFKHQEMYALALEQNLIMHYACVKGDDRLANTSTHPGMYVQQKDGNETKASNEAKAIGYPIYMAFALDDSDSDTDDNFKTTDSDSEEHCSSSMGACLATDEDGVSTEEQTSVMQLHQSEQVISSEDKNGMPSGTAETLTSIDDRNSRNVWFSDKLEEIYCFDPGPVPSQSVGSYLATDEGGASTEEQTSIMQQYQSEQVISSEGKTGMASGMVATSTSIDKHEESTNQTDCILENRNSRGCNLATNQGGVSTEEQTNVTQLHQSNVAVSTSIGECAHQTDCILDNRNSMGCSVHLSETIHGFDPVPSPSLSSPPYKLFPYASLSPFESLLSPSQSLSSPPYKLLPYASMSPFEPLLSPSPSLSPQMECSSLKEN